MKITQKLIKNIFMILVLISIQSYAGIFEGVYTSNTGVQLNIFKIGANAYSISSNHSKLISEAGHNWTGTGVLDNGKYIGVFKYLDNDSKYHGLSGNHQAEFVNDKCFLLYGNTANHKFGPFKYCKQ